MSTDTRLVQSPLPDIRRPDAGHILISEWTAEGPERQRAVIDAVRAAWENHPLPDAFLSRAFLTGTDDRTILNYGQWTDADAHRAFQRDPANTVLAERVADVIGDNPGPDVYALYGAMVSADPPQGEPGCVIGVSFDTEGPEAAGRLVDALLDLSFGVQPGAGAYASNFHIRADGRRMFNYSEWATAEDHQRFIDEHLRPDGETFTMLRGLPGVRPLGFRRYLPYRGLSRR